MKTLFNNTVRKNEVASPTILVFGAGWNPNRTFIERKLTSLSDSGFQVKLAVRKPKNVRSSTTRRKFPVVKILNIFRIGDLFSALFVFITLIFCHPKKLIKFFSVINQSKGSYKSKFVQVITSLPLIKEIPDLIHFEWISQAIDFEWVFDFYDCPVVLSNRGRQLNILPHIPAYEQHVNGLLRVLSKASAVHCVCEDICQVAIDLGMPPEKGVVIYTAVDPYIYKPIHHKRLNDSLKIIMIGSLIWRKGYEFALLALQKAISFGIDARLVIVGSGLEFAHIHFTSYDLGISNRTHLTGELTPDEVLQNLQEADILMHSAVSEGIPNALVEAMACGLPVITTDCGGIREAVDDGVEGYLVPTRDPESMAEAIVRLAKDPYLRIKMGQAGRKRVLRQFNLQDQAQKFIDLYLTLIHKR